MSGFRNFKGNLAADITEPIVLLKDERFFELSLSDLKLTTRSGYLAAGFEDINRKIDFES